MKRPRPGRFTVAAWLLLAMLTVSLLSLPATAQTLCEDQPELPACFEPRVEVRQPTSLSALWDTGVWQDEEAHLELEVEVSYSGDAPASDEPATVHVQAEPIAGARITDGSASLAPGESTTILLDMVATTATMAGPHTIVLHVNTTGTDAYAPTAQTTETAFTMPAWFVRELTEVVETRPTQAGREYTFRVNQMRSNGQMSLLITSRSHLPEPRILGISPELVPEEPRSQQWTVLFQAATGFPQWQMWPVLSTEDGLACIMTDSGDLMPIANQTNEIETLTSLADGCQLIGGDGGFQGGDSSLGGVAGLVFVISNGFVLLAMIGAVVLGVFVLQRGGRKIPARALGLYLIMAGFGFSLLVMQWMIVELFGWQVANRLFPSIVWPMVGTAWALLPVSILLFALGYPTRHPRLRTVKLWWLVPFAPWLLFSPLIFMFIENNDLVFSLVFVYILLGALLAAIIFRQRARTAATRLEGKRVRFMLRSVALPLAAGSALVITVVNLDIHVLDGLFWDTGLAGIIIALVAVSPVAGMAWGLLRYKIVDLDTKLRWTVSRGFIGAIFIAVFFLVAEIVKTYFSHTLGPYIGLVAAALLIPALVPLQRIGNRLATRVVPEPPDPEAYQSFRRFEIYRAAYEEVASDDRVTDKERRAMDTLARSLKLSEDEIKFVESEVAKERQSLERTRGLHAATA